MPVQASSSPAPSASMPRLTGDVGEPLRAREAAATLIRGRRSAQHFDRRATMPLAVFTRLVQALLPAAGKPWDAWPHAIRLHPVIYAHRVDGLQAGAYVLPRDAHGAALLREQLQSAQAWMPASEVLRDVATDCASEGAADGATDRVYERASSALAPLWRIAENPALAGALRTLSCHQAIASDACLAVSLVAEFGKPLQTQADAYRLLFQEAGLIGQALYLQAEAEGLRGTGIGCYFDDAVHELLGIQGQGVQVLYHFTVGVPSVDTRIATEPPYAHLPADQRSAAPHFLEAPAP